MSMIEEHSLVPFLPQNAEVLMLGSFPPHREKWSMEFYYPNFQNDMWRIFGLVFFDDKDYFIVQNHKKFDKEKITGFLFDKGIAVGDSARSVRRLNNNASDKDLEVVEVLNLHEVLNKLPHCRAIMTTGGRAAEVVSHYLQLDSVPKTGGSAVCFFSGRELTIYRLPSSSRAYPQSIEKKASIYQTVFQQIFSHEI